MPIERTFTIDDITPQELAELFLGMYADKQAAFFNAFKAITDTWPGAGWCQQSSGISHYLNSDGIETILKIAEWAANPYTGTEEQSHD